MKKKILYSVIAITLIGVLVYAYMQMSGNTVHKQRAKESLETFLQETYPDMNYEIKQVGYGWTDVTYEFEVVKKDSLAVETTYTFYVSGMEPYEVFSDTIRGTNIDKEVSD
ncbi:YfjL-like protein [Solibacillus sp. FSL K6-4121]|uniref:YfjL-like protein n=1 Tax=Solibacillus sp. FSL K6-4121 TaxID=2921505 RepID=UPI004046C419